MLEKNDIPADWIVSRAHEVMERSPGWYVLKECERPSVAQYECLRCGLVSDLAGIFDPARSCRPHYEHKDSGWLPEC